MSKLAKNLYACSRKLGKLASAINDLETLASGNPKKIIKRAKRKKVGKTLNKINKEIMRKI